MPRTLLSHGQINPRHLDPSMLSRLLQGLVIIHDGGMPWIHDATTFCCELCRTMNDLRPRDSNSEGGARLRLEISPLLSILLSVLLGTVCASCIALAPLESQFVPFEDVLMKYVEHPCTPIIVLVIDGETTRQLVLPCAVRKICFHVQIEMFETCRYTLVGILRCIGI